MIRRASLALAFALPFFVYLLTLAPDLTWAHYGADGGDLVTAAYTLGIPHPPGYPTYTLLAWLFTHLPSGNVAWRVNLLSAISTAAAAVLIHWIVVRIFIGAARTGPQGTTGDVRDRPALIAGLGAALSYAFAPLVWSQALISEVYGLAGLWTALILWLAVLPPGRHEGATRRGQGARPPARMGVCLGWWRGTAGLSFAMGLVWSLGLGIHFTLIFLAPVIVWMVLRRSSSIFCRLSFTVLGFLIGLLVWLYLPLRAGRGGVTWGRPATLDGFWWMVSGALYRDYLFALPLSALGGRLAAWTETWRGAVGLSGAGLATLGVVWLAGRWRSWLVVTGLSFALVNLYALGYNTADSVVYLAAACVFVSIWLGVGLAKLLTRVQRWGRKDPWSALLMLTLALATPAWVLVRNGAALNLSGDRNVQRFCQAVDREAPPRAILLSTTDRQTFSLWYCRQVQGLRPDVAVVDEGLMAFEWYRDRLQQTQPDLWSNQSVVSGPDALTDERPHCRIHREVQTGWLDCQSSKRD